MKEDQDENAELVINELMASNRTGLINEKGKPKDWIELKNLSSDSVNLKGFQLVIKKNIPDSINKKDSLNKELNWTFPELKIGGSEYVLIFADKGKGAKEDNFLNASFKLPKEGATITLLTPKGKILSEVTYGELPNDHSFSLQSDSTYIVTKYQSPGHENSIKGYETAIEDMDAQRKDPLLIWEVMSRSKNSHENWVELKNVGDKEIDLAEYYISKKIGNDEGWQLPDRKLKPGEFITIQLAGNKANKFNPLHANFKLGNAETLVLTKKGKFIDGVNAKSTILGGSIGRKKGEKGFFYFLTPTKNSENGEDGKRFVMEKPLFDKKTGVYPDSAAITLRLKEKNKKVHYTLDGSEPNLNSPLFKDSLIINKTTTIRTFAEGDSISLRSKTNTSTYLIGVSHEIPVINLTVNNNDLYNYNTGIYVDGPGYTQEWPHKGANYWKPMIKKAHVELFDNKDGISTDCGLKIFGGFSRAEAKKSFLLKFKGEYGDSAIDYDFFGEGENMELKDLVLRSGSQDYMRCMLRDEFFTSLMAEQSPTLLIQKYRPVALYINGSYFGLYYMREKIDHHFVSRKLNVPDDSINIIMSKYTELGSSVQYSQLMQFVSTKDMTVGENYEYMKQNVDLQGLIDYKLGEIFSGNSDVGNIRYVRSTSPESDKMWRFVFYDLDASWVGYKPSVEFYLSTGPVASDANVSVHNKMINRLLMNKEFRELFLQRLSHHMTNTFAKENTTKVFDELVAQIQPEMVNNCKRWPQLSYKQWEKNIEEFRKKFEDKPKVMLDGIRSYLNITEEENKKYFGHLGF